MIIRSIPAVMAVFALLAFPLDSRAAVTVLGNDMAQTCSIAALTGRTDKSALESCTAALEGKGLTKRDRAGTYVNRGIIRLHRKLYTDARNDFQTALKLRPGFGEAVVNHGASYVAERRFVEGIEYINRGLEMEPQEPEKAYYNRGLAYENLGLHNKAYDDYLKALELKPGWEAPKRHLYRYTGIEH